jgi:uracil-DNA glycosylase family 4
MMNFSKKNNILYTIKSDVLSAAEQALGKTESDIVFGEGDPDAEIMLIGEAPGAEETRLLRPFVGRAGKNLNEFLAALGLQRSNIYVTNAVKFRPYKVSVKGTLSNRPPKPREIKFMLPFLLREIEVIAPKVVVTLGNVPLKAVYKRDAVIGGCHALPLEAAALSLRFILFPLYHPASVIYNPQLKTVYREDLKKLKTYIAAI